MAAILVLPLHHASPLLPRHRRHSRRRFSIPTVSLSTSTTTWTPSPITQNFPATTDPATTLFHISVDVSHSTPLSSSHLAPGQYLQLRLPSAPFSKPTFLAIASPPSPTSSQFEFLVKRVPGSTAELLCDLKDGDVVELSPVMGKGFPVERIDSSDAVLIFATGTGISAIRSLIESVAGDVKRNDVKLYYGARNLKMMAYQDRFKSWEYLGVKVIPVLSQPDDHWKGEHGYVQNAFSKKKPILDPASTAVVLCGHKQMLEDITSVLTSDGIPKDKILTNF